MKLYIENLKDTTGKLLKLVNKFSNVAGYKINVWKSVALLHTSDKISERKIKETILFITASKITQYLRINLSKKAKDLHSENYKMLMKKSKMLQMERYSIFWDWKDQ